MPVFCSSQPHRPTPNRDGYFIDHGPGLSVGIFEKRESRFGHLSAGP
jgi:hypothetical protein